MENKQKVHLVNPQGRLLRNHHKREKSCASVARHAHCQISSQLRCGTVKGPTTVWNKPTNIHRQNEGIARAILKCTDPVKMKRWGDKIPDSPEWNQQKRPLMKELVSIKIKTYQEAQHTLLTSGDAILVEAVEDPIWASGLNYNATLKVHPEEWPGQNIKGQLWMDERKRLVRNQP